MMELTGSDALASLLKIPKKASVKKTTKDIENEHLLQNGLPDVKSFAKFYTDLQKADNVEEQMRLMNILNKTSAELVEKFTNVKGIGMIVDLLGVANRRHAEKSELIEEILSFLEKIRLTSEIIERTQIHIMVEDVKESINLSDDLCNRAKNLVEKWNQNIEDWKNHQETITHHAMTDQDDSEMMIREEDNDQGNDSPRNFIRRTHDNTREGPRFNDREPMNSDLKRKPRMQGQGQNDRRDRDRDRDRDGMRRNGPPYHNNMRGRSRYDRDGPSRWPDRRRRNSMSSSDDDRYPKKTVKWVEDPKLTHVKYFRFNDEPVAAGLTEEEVMKIRQRLLNDESNFYSFHSSEEYKHKESLMEGQSMKMKKDSEKDIQEKLSKMQEKIKWERPRKISHGEGNLYANGRESKVRELQQKRIANKLPCFYLKEYQIPDQPSYEAVTATTTTTAIMVEEPGVIPLRNVNEKCEPTDIAIKLEEMIHKNDQEPVVKKEEKEESKLKEESTTESSKETKKAEIKPVKSILKKSKEELRRIREEERREAEIKRKAEEAKNQNIPNEKLLQLLKGELSKEESNDLIARIQSSKNAKNTIENLRILEQVMNTQRQQEQLPPAGDFGRPRVGNHPLNSYANHHDSNPNFYGEQPYKKLRMNPDPINAQNAFNNLPNQPYQSGLQYAGKPMPGEFPPISPGLGQKYSPGSLPPYAADGDYGMDMEDDDFANGKKPYRPQNYKTVPCRLFHSAIGCTRGETCHFIHDLNYAGRETPNMHKYVRPLHSLSKNPQNNQQNLNALKDSGSDYEMEPDRETFPNEIPVFKPPVLAPTRSSDGPDGYPSNSSLNKHSFPPTNHLPTHSQPQNAHLAYNPALISQTQTQPQQAPQQQHHHQTGHHYGQQPPPQQQSKSLPIENRQGYQQGQMNNGPPMFQKNMHQPPQHHFNANRPQQSQPPYFPPSQHQAQPPPYGQNMHTYGGNPSLQQPSQGFPYNKGPQGYQQNQPSHMQNRTPPPSHHMYAGPPDRGFNNPPPGMYNPRVQNGSGMNSNMNPYNGNPPFKPTGPPTGGPGPGGYYPYNNYNGGNDKQSDNKY